MKDNILEVHFDYKKEGKKLYCGYVFKDDGEIIDSGLVDYDLTKRIALEEREKRKNNNFTTSNNYHYSLTSYYVAVEKVKKFLYENSEYNVVLYCNQNELIFDWVINEDKKLNDTYKKIVTNIRKELHNVWLLVGDSTVHNCMKIDKSKNEAKKALKKRLKVVGTESEIKEIEISEFDLKNEYEVSNKYEEGLINLLNFEND